MTEAASLTLLSSAQMIPLILICPFFHGTSLTMLEDVVTSLDSVMTHSSPGDVMIEPWIKCTFIDCRRDAASPG